MNKGVDGDLPKAFGFDSLEGCDDPPDVWIATPKLQTLEFRCTREVERGWRRRGGWVHGKGSGINQPRKLTRNAHGIGEPIQRDFKVSKHLETKSSANSASSLR